MAAPGANYDGPVTKVELYVSCSDLVNKDVFSKSDPFAVLFETKPGLGQRGWMVGKTEVIYDNLNPKVSGICTDYYLVPGYDQWS